MGIPLRVLIIEDSPDDADLEVQELRRAGFDVRFERVAALDEMREALRRGTWDVVLSDYTVPGLRSDEALALVRELRLDIPFIVVSGAIGEELAAAAVRAGCHDYVLKSNLRRLASAVQRELREAERRRACRAAEELLKDGDTPYRSFLRDFLGIAYRCTPDLTPIFIHGAVEAITGYTEQEFMSGLVRWDRIVYPPDLRNRLSQVSFVPGFTGEQEYRIVRKDGGLRWVHELVGNVCDATGKPAFVQGAIYDITERRRAEEALNESENRYRSLFFSMREGSALHRIVYDEAGRPVDYVIVDVNPSYEKIADLPRTSCIGRRASEVYETDSPPFLETFARVAQTRIAESFETYFGCVGKYLRISVYSPAPGEFVTIFDDITEQKAAEEALDRSEEQLRQAQKMEAVGTLASGIAHDFNNLLTAIFGYTALAKKALPAGHPTIHFLEMIEEAAQQAGGVTKALLTFSRKAVAERRPVDLGRTVSESLRLLRRVLPASVDVVEDVPSEAIWVCADVTRIQQVLINLAVNARDAMPDGGRLRIVLRQVPASETGWETTDRNRPEAYARLTVEDTGIGMPENVKRRIFEPFFTTKARGHGTGLGMSIVHGIVTDHMGRIDVRSEVGSGTQVTIWLPCCAAPRDFLREAPPPTHAQGHGESILLAEDNDHVRAIMVSTLRSRGYSVIEASDGDAVMAAIEAHREDTRLVVLDLDLPKMTGLDCLRQIRQVRPDMPAIIVTGRVEFDPARHLGKNDFLLRKPFAMAEFTGTVARALRTAARQEVPS